MTNICIVHLLYNKSGEILETNITHEISESFTAKQCSLCNSVQQRITWHQGNRTIPYKPTAQHRSAKPSSHLPASEGQASFKDRTEFKYNLLKRCILCKPYDLLLFYLLDTIYGLRSKN